MRDELFERVVGELRTLPPVDEAAVRRIVIAASEDENAMAAARGARKRFGARFAIGDARWLHSRIPLAAAAGFAAAAGLAGYAVRAGSTPAPVIVAASSTESPMVALAVQRPLPAEVPTQFVLDAPRAARVTLVGDFNAWNGDETPLVRDPASGIWTAMVPLAPGRHVYAFMVDGATWTLDPRAPTAQDPDFGTPSSVVLVGTP
jgi:hypothetical protein